MIGKTISHYQILEKLGEGGMGVVYKARDTHLDRFVALQMADALAAAHEAGIVHRDLKPGNLMVTDKGRVKVLDFGLAKLTEKLPTGAEDATLTAKPDTEEGKIVGTVAYMSPEQAEGKKVDARSDIFSFGSVLYEMVSGKRAFEADSKASTQGAIIHKDPVPLSGRIPHDLEKAITRCLRKERERRWQTMADLKVALEELKEESDSGALEAAGVPGGAVRGRFWWAGVLAGIAVVVAALGIAGWYWLGRSRPKPVEAPLTAVPLTSYRGGEDSPNFSPDGTQVAFHWCREGQNCHIYIKQVGVEPPFQLTNAAVDDFSPAWSPDGRFIAFIRVLEPKKLGLYLVPQRGGPERQLETWDVSKMSLPLEGPFLAWTQDSKWLAFPRMEAEQRSHSLFLISVQTVEKRRLTSPPTGLGGDTAPAFSPDGHTLAFWRQTETLSELYLLHLGEDYSPQKEPERVATGNPWIFGAAWTPDGREIVFSSGGSWSKGLWRIEVSKSGKPVRLGFAPDNAGAPSISRTGKRLAYSVGRFDSNIWRVDLEGPGRKPGKPVQFISSTKAEYCPAYSPDGKRIAFVSDQSGVQAIWICDSNGWNIVQLTEADAWAVRWSPDGERIAYDATVDGNQDVYVVGTRGGAPQRLTTQPGVEKWPFWSRDGRWLYFTSDRTGQWEIWKMPSQGGEAIQVTRTKEGVDVPQESPDGRFIYYNKGYPFTLSVWRMPVEGGKETKVLDPVHPEPMWTLRQEGIYFVTVRDDKGSSDFCFYEFASGKTRKILKMEGSIFGTIAVSPDGRTLLYGQNDESGSDLMLVENFR